MKFIAPGDVTRTTTCKQCDKIFRGNARNVDKQVSLHYKAMHKCKPEKYPRIKLGVDITTDTITDTYDKKKDVDLMKEFGMLRKRF